MLFCQIFIHFIFLVFYEFIIMNLFILSLIQLDTFYCNCNIFMIFMKTNAFERFEPKLKINTFYHLHINYCL